MLSRMGLWIGAGFRRVMPDPFVIAVLLTVVTVMMAMAWGTLPGAGTGEDRAGGLWGTLDDLIRVMELWGSDQGMWGLLAFSMQMCLILVTGHALAATHPVSRMIGWLARLPRSGGQAAAMVALVACVCGLVNWGLGLIVGALLAREVGRVAAARGVAVHYPVIASAGYMGLMVWHGGLSGSAPLSTTTRDGAAKVLPGAYVEMLEGGAVPLSQTLFTAQNLIITGGLVVIAPVMLWLLSPKRGGDAPPRLPQSLEQVREGPAADETLPERMDRGPWLAWLLAAALAAVLIRYSATRGISAVGLNQVNMAMLALGLVLHGSVRGYIAAAEEAVRGCTGIILQFPLYAGIMGIMVQTGLVKLFAARIGEMASAQTLPLFTFGSAAVLNLFVPSGGGQWAVQGPVALESAVQLGVAPGKVIMAVAYGDQITNMLQPFWALPLLAITGVRARDIVGYTAVVMAVGIAWVSVCLVVL
jgi:short-chain fatty acids transporter